MLILLPLLTWNNKRVHLIMLKEHYPLEYSPKWGKYTSSIIGPGDTNLIRDILQYSLKGAYFSEVQCRTPSSTQYTITPASLSCSLCLVLWPAWFKGPIWRKSWFFESHSQLVTFADCRSARPPSQSISFWRAGSETKKSTFLTVRTFNFLIIETPLVS